MGFIHLRNLRKGFDKIRDLELGHHAEPSGCKAMHKEKQEAGHFYPIEFYGPCIAPYPITLNSCR